MRGAAAGVSGDESVALRDSFNQEADPAHADPRRMDDRLVWERRRRRRGAAVPCGSSSGSRCCLANMNSGFAFAFGFGFGFGLRLGLGSADTL